MLPHVRTTVLDAFDRAHITLDDVDGFEVHDCFTPSEYLGIDHIGLTSPGESWKAIENGEIEIGGRLPINPSGGLIGGGHPVGATGVRMLLDAARQVSDTAGDYQVEGAKTFAILNFGGSTATTVSFVIGRRRTAWCSTRPGSATGRCANSSCPNESRVVPTRRGRRGPTFAAGGRPTAQPPRSASSGCSRPTP